MQQPSWGLYRRQKLNAAVRADSLKEAKAIFTKHGYCGRIKKLGN